MTTDPLDKSGLIRVPETLHDLADKYDVDAPEPSGPNELEAVDGDAIVENMSAEAEQELINCKASTSGDEPPAAGTRIGEVGSRVTDYGRVDVPVQNYAPWVVRGHHGDDGLYEEYYRTEPQIFQPTNTVTGMLVAGDHAVQMPGEVKPSHESAVREFVDWCNGWLHGIRHSSPGGLRSFIQHAASAQIFGFALHETVWATDDEGRWHPDAYLYREQNTVDKWIIGDRESELIATQHRGIHLDGYTLPAGGPSQRERRVLLSNLHARGNNFEGISFIRPNIHWIKTKRVLGQIVAVSADKYGAPITKIQEDPDFTQQGGADESDKQDLFEVFRHLRATEGAITTVPAGLDVDIMSPTGTMPSLGDMMRYCDEMIASSWQNQGSTLTSGTVGSYALSKVEDQKFVRSVPPIHRQIVQPVNEQIRHLAKRYLEDRVSGELLAYPEVGFSLDHVTDTSSWVSDMVDLMGKKPLPEWPEALQEKALDRMGLDQDLLRQDDTPEPQSPDQPTPDPQVPGGVDAPEEST